MEYTQEQKDFWKQYFFSRGMLTIENAAIFADEALAEFNKRFVTPKEVEIIHTYNGVKYVEIDAIGCSECAFHSELISCNRPFNHIPICINDNENRSVIYKIKEQ
jgi:hypothetical protein